MSKRCQIKVACTAKHEQDILALRQLVYVVREERLSSVNSMQATFDCYDKYGTYLLAYDKDKPVGAIKIITDSPLGLPCEAITNLEELRQQGARLVEFGHLITSPDMRGARVVIDLIREAIVFAITRCRATHMLADMFFDQDRPKGFNGHVYNRLGFDIQYGPYNDHRFLNAPQSLIVMLDHTKLAEREEIETGAIKRLLQEINQKAYQSVRDNAV